MKKDIRNEPTRLKDDKVSVLNHTSEPLSIGETWEGGYEITHYEHVAINVNTDGGCIVVATFADNNGVVMFAKTYTIPNGGGTTYDSLVKLPFRNFKLTITSVVENQTFLSANIYYGNNLFPSSSSAFATISNTTSLLNTRSVITGRDINDDYQNVRVSTTGELIIADASADVGIDDEIYKFLDTVGDSSGTKNAIGNYSGAVEEFKITPPVGYNYTINRMLVHIRDSGAMSGSEYGAIPELTNGISLKLKDDSNVTLLDLTDGIPNKTNAGWAKYCHDISFIDEASGDNYISVRWTFSIASAILLYPGYSLVIELNDDLTGLIEHYFTVQGFRKAV